MNRLLILFILFKIITTVISDNQNETKTIKKCCSIGYIFNSKLECIKNITSKLIIKDITVESKFIFDDMYNDDFDNEIVNINGKNKTKVNYNNEENNCVEETRNGSKILAKRINNSNSSRGVVQDKADSLGSVIFWGAQTYMSTNIAHVIVCIIVVMIYMCIPELERGLYNRCVLRHNICHMMNGLTLSLLGFCELGECIFPDYLMILSWLCLQYFTIATVFWLNVICFDMTLAITRFRWINKGRRSGGSRHRSDPADANKLLIYGIFAWGGSLLPTSLAALCDYIPGIPENFILKPNYLKFREGPRPIVNLYYFLVPAFTLLLNNILFVFTTIKIIKIQQSTEIATRNQRNLLKKKYFLFLRLYVLMGAPWFFGMVFACMNKLFILKMCRMIQPSLWLLILITHKQTLIKFKSIFMKYKSRKCNVATISTE